MTLSSGVLVFALAYAETPFKPPGSSEPGGGREVLQKSSSPMPMPHVPLKSVVESSQVNGSEGPRAKEVLQKF